MVCLNLTKAEATSMVTDIIKGFTQLLIVHFLQHFIDGQHKFLSTDVLKLIIYVMLSMIIFHLVVKKIFLPTNDETEPKEIVDSIWSFLF